MRTHGRSLALWLLGLMGCLAPAPTPIDAGAAGDAPRALVCAAGAADCDGLAENGCEVMIQDDPHHCGGCGQACALAHGVSGCTSGRCALARCDEGFADRDRVASNGCEAVPTDCDGLSNNGREADTQTSPMNCGACGRVCAAGTHVAPTCAAGVCGTSCAPGFDDVDGDASNGCETRASRDERNCGAPGVSCSLAQTCVGWVCVATALRQIAPISTSRVTTRRPTLRWLPRHDHLPVRLEVCSAPDCAALEVSLTTTGASVRLTADLSPGVHFWRLVPVDAPGEAATPLWEFFVPARSAPQDTAFGIVPDINADGLADLVVHRSDSPEHMSVHLGARGAVSAVADPRFAPPADSAGRPLSAATLAASDLNGDGAGDLVYVTYTLGTTAGPGVTAVYLGSPTGLRDGEVWSHRENRMMSSGMYRGVQYNWALAPGDLNGDGYADVMDLAITSQRGWSSVGFITSRSHGATFETGVPVPYSWYFAFVVAGDLNGDGLADVAQAGGESSPSFSLGTELDDRWFEGYRLEAMGPPLVTQPVGPAGDINGDGYSDVFWSNCLNSATVTDRCVFLGGADGLGRWRYWPLGNDDCAALGDINHDGFDDIVCASAGSRVVFWGGPSAPMRTTIAPLSWVGRAVRLGDTDGDHIDDFALVGGGMVTLWRGQISGLPETPALTLAGDAVAGGW